MREIVHLQAGQCGNQIGGKVSSRFRLIMPIESEAHNLKWRHHVVIRCSMMEACCYNGYIAAFNRLNCFRSEIS